MEQLKEILNKLKGIEIKSNPVPFNMLNIAYQDVTAKERLHSKLLAGLLDPKENHALNGLCFETFLKHTGVTCNNEYINSVCVTTEYNINGRFIDIFIEWNDSNNKKHAIIIENKLHDAPDQTNQLNDYFKGICELGYIVEKIIYVPFDKSYKSFQHTDSTDEVKEKCIDFDANNIVKWLDETISKIPKENAGILIQYKEFFNCLINQNNTYMEVQKILNQLSIKDIDKLEQIADTIANSKQEWAKAFFNPITTKLQERFGENLNVGYRYQKIGKDDVCAYYVQYWFEEHYWLELGKAKLSEGDNIGIYIVSKSNEPNIKLGNETYENIGDCYQDGDYFYENQHKSWSFYAPDNSESIQNLLNAIIPILDELSKYK